MTAPSFDPVLARVLIAPGKDVQAMLARGVDAPAAPLAEALIRGAQLFGRSVGERTLTAEEALIPLLLQRWSGHQLGDLSVQALNDWYLQLRNPSIGKGLSRVDLTRLHRAVWTALSLDAVEARSGEYVITGAFGLTPGWTASSGSGVGAPALTGLAIAVGSAIGRGTARRGGQGSTAGTLPAVKACNVWVTEQRVLLTPTGAPHHIVWAVDRAAVSGAHRYPHVQLMCRSGLVFADGSKASFYAGSKGPALALQAALGVA